MTADNESQRVRDLANSLKAMHLATTMEEAYERAKQIVSSTKSDAKDVPLSDVVRVQKVLDEPPKQPSEVTFDKVKAELAALKKEKAIREDARIHEKEKKEAEVVKQRVASEEAAVKDVEDILNMADKVKEEQS